MSQKVYLIDDDTGFRQATARMLRLWGCDVEEYASPTDFLHALQPEWGGCVVVDPGLPASAGLALQRELKARHSLLPVVFLAARGSIAATVEAMRQGAEDFLTKDAPREDLMAAVKRALARHARALREWEEQERLQARLRALTPREREVLQQVARGRMNKQIAADLGIHERTVKLHRAAGIRKMRVSSVAELSVLWHRLHEEPAEE